MKLTRVCARARVRAVRVTSASSQHRSDISDLSTFALRRAEEEDEHLERTLEQNKGKMAKKEEKCVLQ